MSAIVRYWFGGVLLLAGLTAVCVLGWWLGRALMRLARAWRYDRTRAKHLTVVEQAPEQDFYGSMTLAGERVPDEGYWLPYFDESGQGRVAFLPAPEVAHSGWWGQTAADLAPEALDGGCLTCNPGNPGWITCVDYDGSGYETACPDCSGPGAGSSLAPGPGCPECGQPRLLLNGGPHCPRCGWAESPDPELLGPNAARVLARYERRRRERWRLDWDNEAAA